MEEKEYREIWQMFEKWFEDEWPEFEKLDKLAEMHDSENWKKSKFRKLMFEMKRAYDRRKNIQ